MQYKYEQFSVDISKSPVSKMVKVLVALCIVAAVQVCSAYEVAVPVFRQPYGVGETRIIGGQTAKKGQFPHQAGLTVDGRAFCGGSLISKNWVLTAGHCVVNFNTWVIALGAQDIREDNEPGRVTVTSSRGIGHEKYYPETLANDVGVISLRQGVQLSDTINIIKLPPRSYQNQNLAGKTVRVSGWGRTSDSSPETSPTLQFVDLSLISLADCKAVYGNIIDETRYCCSGANRTSTCNGDSGGALTIGSGADLVNLGIVSFGSSAGCAKGYPSGYTAVPFFVDWISEKTGIPVSDF